jgi:hypothetical protein
MEEGVEMEDEVDDKGARQLNRTFMEERVPAVNPGAARSLSIQAVSVI